MNADVSRRREDGLEEAFSDSLKLSEGNQQRKLELHYPRDLVRPLRKSR